MQLSKLKVNVVSKLSIDSLLEKNRLTFIFALSQLNHLNWRQTERQQQANNANNIFFPCLLDSVSCDSSTSRRAMEISLVVLEISVATCLSTGVSGRDEEEGKKNAG